MAAILDKKNSSTGILGTFHHAIKWASKQLSWKFQLSTFFPGWHDFWANAPGLIAVAKNSMMTSSNASIFRITGPLCGEFTGPLWIPRTKASDAEL